MAGLLLPDTKLIALKPDIYCYFTSLDLGIHLKVSEIWLLFLCSSWCMRWEWREAAGTQVNFRAIECFYQVLSETWGTGKRNHYRKS